MHDELRWINECWETGNCDGPFVFYSSEDELSWENRRKEIKQRFFGNTLNEIEKAVDRLLDLELKHSNEVVAQPKLEEPPF